MMMVFRRSYGYQDELCWGAAWLYKATGETTYKTKAEQALSAGGGLSSSEFSWDDKGMGCIVSDSWLMCSFINTYTYSSQL